MAARVLDSGFIAIVLSAVAPAVFFFSRNYTAYKSEAVWTTLAGIAALGVAIGLAHAAAAWACRRLSRGGADAARARVDVDTLTTVILALGLFAAFSHFSWSRHIEYPEALVPYAVGAAVLYVLVDKAGFKALNVFLLVFTVMSAAALYRSESHYASLGVDFSPPKAMPADFRLNRKPNIYFMFLESFHPRAALREIYGADAPEFFERLDRTGFVIHDRVHANYNGTLQAALPLLTMRHHYWRTNFGVGDESRAAREAVCENAVFAILKNNGYSVNLFDHNNYVFRFNSPLFDFTSFKLFDNLTRQVADALIAMNGRFAALSRFQPRELEAREAFFTRRVERPGEDDHLSYEEFRDFYPDAFDLEKPAFFFFHFGADHAPGWQRIRTGDAYPGRNGSTWDEIFVDRYRKAGVMIGRMVDCILETDPGALIVLLGDHGAYKHGEYLDTKGMSAARANAYLREKGLSPGYAARNLVSVLLAIRWPDGIRPVNEPRDGFGDVNLFPYLFHALNGAEYDDDLFEPNVAYQQVECRVVAKYGEILEDWEEFSEKPDRAPLPTDGGLE